MPPLCVSLIKNKIVFPAGGGEVPYKGVLQMKPTLVIMAAGMGSRFGGLKQLEPITEKGEAIMDFSVMDALDAGFEKIVIIIKGEIQELFEEKVGRRLKQFAHVEYAYQEISDLPKGFTPFAGREKPWGTGQAVLAAKDLVKTPFAVINADDYYGKSAFVVMADFLENHVNEKNYAMIGYPLGNTLTAHGSVARGICETEQGCLTNLTERTNIIKRETDAAFSEDGGQTWHPLPLNVPVSMQFFGFHPSVFSHLHEGFCAFLENDPLKKEYYLPGRIGELVRDKKINVHVLASADHWFGVTYKEDKPAVVAAIKELRG